MVLTFLYSLPLFSIWLWFLSPLLFLIYNICSIVVEKISFLYLCSDNLCLWSDWFYPICGIICLLVWLYRICKYSINIKINEVTISERRRIYLSSTDSYIIWYFSVLLWVRRILYLRIDWCLYMIFRVQGVSVVAKR